MLKDPYIQELLKEANLNSKEREYIRVLIHRFSRFPNEPTYNEIVYRLLTSRQKISFLDKLRDLKSKNNERSRNEELEDDFFQDVIQKIVNPDEQSFLIEALNCYSAQAYRACIIMIWTTVVDHLYSKIDKEELNTLINAIKERFSKNKNYLKINHIKKLQTLKDKDLFILLQDINIIDSNLRKTLERHLDLRNTCAHPNEYKISKSVVDAYIEDLIHNILLK